MEGKTEKRTPESYSILLVSSIGNSLKCIKLKLVNSRFQISNAWQQYKSLKHILMLNNAVQHKLLRNSNLSPN